MHKTKTVVHYVEENSWFSLDRPLELEHFGLVVDQVRQVATLEERIQGCELLLILLIYIVRIGAF